MKHGYCANKKLNLLYYVAMNEKLLQKFKYYFADFVRYLQPNIVILVFVILHFQTFILVTLTLNFFTPIYSRKCYNLDMGLTFD